MCAAILFNIKQQGPSRKIGMRWLHTCTASDHLHHLFLTTKSHKTIAQADNNIHLLVALNRNIG